MTETPATSRGYWKARNSPALPRTSVDQSVMSSPLKRMAPFVTTYSGLPSRTAASVDLPEPLGPMSAWTSPGRTTRSTPWRISTPSALEAWRSRTSNKGGEDPGGGAFTCLSLGNRAD